MKPIVFILSILAHICFASEAFADRDGRTEAKCYAGKEFKIYGALDHCDDFCKAKGYRGAVGWKCGSDIRCEDSKCMCICKMKEKDREEGRKEHKKKEDGTSIKIPLGDGINIELNK